MDTHFAILPTTVLDVLSLKLNNEPAVRFLSLPHPRTSIPSLFLPSTNAQGSTTILEVQAVNPPNKRSWFIDQEFVADGKLLTLTPVDPVFILIPILLAVQPVDNSTAQFRPLDDIFEDAATRLEEQSAKDADSTARISRADILSTTSLGCTQPALKRICDVKEITSEITVYRYNPQKLVDYLRKKVDRLSCAAIFESSKTLIRGLAKDGFMDDGKEDLLQDGRLRASCDLVSQYLPPMIRDALVASYNFEELNKYLEILTTAAQEAAAASAPLVKTKSLTKSSSTKSTTEDKKRKNTNKSSQGVEKLKRVNTDNMGKLSSFFAKK